MRELVCVSSSRQKSCKFSRNRTLLVVLDGGFGLNGRDGACKHTTRYIHKALAVFSVYTVVVGCMRCILVSFQCYHKQFASPRRSLLQPFTLTYTIMRHVSNSNVHRHALYATVDTCGLVFLCNASSYGSLRCAPGAHNHHHHHRAAPYGSHASMLSQPTMVVPLHRSLSQ